MISTIAAAVIAVAVINPAPASYSVCRTLNAEPNYSGIVQVMFDLTGAGYSGDEAGEILVTQVLSRCPSYLPMLEQFVTDFGG